MSVLTLVAYNQYSVSATAIKNELAGNGCGNYLIKRISGKCFRNDYSLPQLNMMLTSPNVVFNWGAYIPHSLLPSVVNGRAHNYSDKLKFFEGIEQGDYHEENSEPLAQHIPEWTTDPTVVSHWLEEGDTVIARASTKLSGGAGIVVCKPGDLFPYNYPLYTKYIKKNAEFRVHFFKQSNTINYFFQKKKRVPSFSVENPNDVWTVRNHANGWLFSSINFDTPEAVSRVARKFARDINLTYGAFDIIYNKLHNQAFVLEVNTAPGLSEKTLKFYTDNIRQYVGAV